MNQALAALVVQGARSYPKKTVTIHFDGTGGKLPAGMGYLVETPVWKTTYRLLLPDAKSTNNADLQAWAIVENQTDNDWQDVSLSLVGGRPIRRQQKAALSAALYFAAPGGLADDLWCSVVPQTYADNGFTLDGVAGSHWRAAAANLPCRMGTTTRCCHPPTGGATGARRRRAGIVCRQCGK